MLSRRHRGTEGGSVDGMLWRVAAEGAGINKEESQAAESLTIPLLFKGSCNNHPTTINQSPPLPALPPVPPCLRESIFFLIIDFRCGTIEDNRSTIFRSIFKQLGVPEDTVE